MNNEEYQLKHLRLDIMVINSQHTFCDEGSPLYHIVRGAEKVRIILANPDDPHQFLLHRWRGLQNHYRRFEDYLQEVKATINYVGHLKTERPDNVDFRIYDGPYDWRLILPTSDTGLYNGACVQTYLPNRLVLHAYNTQSYLFVQPGEDQFGLIETFQAIFDARWGLLSVQGNRPEA